MQYLLIDGTPLLYVAGRVINLDHIVSILPAGKGGDGHSLILLRSKERGIKVDTSPEDILDFLETSR